MATLYPKSRADSDLIQRSPQPIRCRTFFHDGVIRKLSGMFSIMVENFPIGTEKLSVSRGTYGRAETSNIPRTARGRAACRSR